MFGNSGCEILEIVGGFELVIIVDIFKIKMNSKAGLVPVLVS
jgi:hypothetical protein